VRDIVLSNSNGPVVSIARPGSILRLTFRVADESELPVALNPPEWVINIGPPGSAAPTFSSVSPQTGADRSYTYFWTVPDPPGVTGIGCSLTVQDIAGNVRSVSSTELVVIGNRQYCIVCLNLLRFLR